MGARSTHNTSRSRTVSGTMVLPLGLFLRWQVVLATPCSRDERPRWERWKGQPLPTHSPLGYAHMLSILIGFLFSLFFKGKVPPKDDLVRYPIQGLTLLPLTLTSTSNHNGTHSVQVFYTSAHLSVLQRANGASERISPAARSAGIAFHSTLLRTTLVYATFRGVRI